MTDPGPQSRPLSAAAAGLELSWRLAWANFLSLVLLGGAWPWKIAVAHFFLAGGLSLFLRERKTFVLVHVLVHALGLAGAGLQTVHYLHAAQESLLDWAWLVELFGRPQPVEFRLSVILEGFLAGGFWFGGLFWARRKKNYQMTTIRFDIGLSAFLLLFLIKFLLRVKFSYGTPSGGDLPLMLSFITLGLLSVALSRTRGRARREFQAGFKGLGVVLSFICLGLLTAGGLIGFLMPQLTSSAETGLEAIKFLTRPLGPVIVSFLKMAFGPRNMPSENPYGGGGGAGGESLAGEQPAGWWSALGLKIMGWGATGLLGLAFLILALYGFYRLWRFLFSLTPGMKPPGKGESSRRRRLAGLVLLISLLLERLVRVFRPGRDPVSLYFNLVDWGRRGGLPLRSGETPREYGRRLSGHFPMAAREIGVIVEALECFVFAGRAPGAEVRAAAGEGIRRLARPDLWPWRVRTWFSSGEAKRPEADSGFRS